LEGATVDAATVVASETLLVYGRPGEREVSLFVEEVNSVLAGTLVFFFDVVGDLWRIVVDVGGHDCFGAIN
jgi:hypothetical protein